MKIDKKKIEVRIMEEQLTFEELTVELFEYMDLETEFMEHDVTSDETQIEENSAWRWMGFE